MLKRSYNQSALNMTIYTNCCSAYLSYRSEAVWKIVSGGCREALRMFARTRNNERFLAHIS